MVISEAKILIYKIEIITRHKVTHGSLLEWCVIIVQLCNVISALIAWCIGQ